MDRLVTTFRLALNFSDGFVEKDFYDIMNIILQFLHRVRRRVDITGIMWMKKLVILSREWKTREFCQARMATAMGPWLSM